MLQKRLSLLLSMLVVLSLLLTACPSSTPAEPAAEAPAEEAAEAPAEEAAPTEAPAEEAAPTEAPAEEAAAEESAGGDYLNATRAETVIFDIDGGRVTDPELWNPFVPGNRRDHGYHQAILEPLFILNYQTGEFIPWLAESFEANETQDVWTLHLREGVTWQDGEAFNADDVVFTMNMLLENSPELGDSAAQADWVASVEKIDDLTVQYNLTRPNPRYQLDYWSVKIWGGISIMPEHVWAGQDPLTFKYYDPAQGWPMGTGPYKLASISPTEFAYVRDDNWWAPKPASWIYPSPRS